MNELYDSSDLSDAGARRREEILHLALLAAHRRRQRRRAIRIGACAALLLAMLVISPLWRGNHPVAHFGQPTNTRLPAPRVVPPPPSEKPRVVVIRIETDPTLLQRLSVPPYKPRWKTLNDDELLRELAEAGRPAGLEYGSHGEVVVLYR